MKLRSKEKFSLHLLNEPIAISGVTIMFLLVNEVSEFDRLIIVLSSLKNIYSFVFP